MQGLRTLYGVLRVYLPQEQKKTHLTSVSAAVFVRPFAGSWHITGRPSQEAARHFYESTWCRVTRVKVNVGVHIGTRHALREMMGASLITSWFDAPARLPAVTVRPQISIEINTWS